MTVAAIAALDDPRDASRLQKEAMELASRLGQRTMEINILGNVAEDLRRTGDWEWIDERLELAQRLDLDAADMIVVDSVLAALAALRGTLGDELLAELAARIGTLDDRDVGSSTHDLRGLQAFGQGRWADAATAWLPAVELSDFNAPYILPRIAVAAILARDAVGAGAALDRLDRMGTRGRVPKPSWRIPLWIHLTPRAQGTSTDADGRDHGRAR